MKLKRRSQAVWLGVLAYGLLKFLNVPLDVSVAISLMVGTYVYDSIGF